MSLSFCQLNQLINEQGPPPPPPPVRADHRTKILKRVLDGLKKGLGTDDAKQLGGSFTDENLRTQSNLDDETINAAKKLGILVRSDQGHWQLGRGIMDAILTDQQPKPGLNFDRESHVVRPRSNDGDRAKKLESIADQLSIRSSDSIGDWPTSLDGYARQLRRIADELRQANDRRKRKDRVVGGVFDEPGRQS